MADISKINVNGTEYNIKDTEARNQGPSLPTGGTIGQVLAKRSNTDGDAGWYFPGHYPTDKWYLPDGIQESQVLGAWQFIDRESEAVALIDLVHGYAASKSNNNISWNSAQGLIWPESASARIAYYLYCQNITNIRTQCICAAFGYKMITNINNRDSAGIRFDNNQGLYIQTGTHAGVYVGPAMTNGNSSSTVLKNSDLKSNGVLSCNWIEAKLYHNGVNLSLSSYSTVEGTVPCIFGEFNYDAFSRNKIQLTALVFYSTGLSEYHHQQITNNIRALGGID